MKKDIETICITGGGGYVGSALLPKLLRRGHRVKVLDLFIYGEDVLEDVKDNPNLEIIKGDIRDQSLLKEILPGCTAVLHLACISNDPSFELNPNLGKSINYDAFEPLVDISKASGVQRFIYASSSSVYGIKKEKNVTEDLSVKPLTDYSKYKALCEDILLRKREPGFATLVIRPATVCGFAPRLRLDVVVNIFVNHAYTNRKVKVLGGEQLRPNIHIGDMTDLYVKVIESPLEKIDGKTYNAGYHNNSVEELARVVKSKVGKDVILEIVPTNDARSYHISSEKLKREFGFEPSYTIEDAVKSLLDAFQGGKIPNSMTDNRYYNIKTMQAINLQ